MPIWRIVSRVSRAAIIAVIASCVGILMAAAQEELPTAKAQAAWPDNEPDGMTPIIAVDGSSKDWSGFGRGGPWENAERVTVVEDPASKYGRAVEKRFFAGDKSGWHGRTWRGRFGAYRELYQRVVFRVSPNWQWHRSGSKFFYWGGSGRPDQRGPTQFYINATGSGQVQFVNQSASGARESRGTFRANAPTVSRDRYHTIELLHIANTPGLSDGALRMWIDGVEVRGFNHIGHSDQKNVRLENVRWLDYDDTRLTGVEAFMFWGGQGDTKQVNDWIRLAELYVSGKD